MKSLEILVLENQIVLMESMINMNELSNYKKEELRKQIKKSRELLAFLKN
jgi:hypothetical protein